MTRLRSTPPGSTGVRAEPFPDRGAVERACRLLLRPVASLLLKCGMTWREFAEVSKEVFVAVASEDYGLNGRPTNVSRVSILTGISRKEVTRVRAALGQETALSPRKTTDATRLLAGWHQDPDFLTATGEPRPLPAEGPGATFAALWQRYGGDVPLTSMRKELERTGAVSRLPDGTLRAERRYFTPRRFDSRWLVDAGSLLRDLGTSIAHNLDAGAAPVGDSAAVAHRRFIGRATRDGVDVAALPEFQAFVEQNAGEFLARIDNWLALHDAGPAPANGRKRLRLGLGVFLISGE